MIRTTREGDANSALAATQANAVNRLAIAKAELSDAILALARQQQQNGPASDAILARFHGVLERM
jgi:hypothetical protein